MKLLEKMAKDHAYSESHEGRDYKTAFHSYQAGFEHAVELIAGDEYDRNGHTPLWERILKMGEGIGREEG